MKSASLSTYSQLESRSYKASCEKHGIAVRWLCVAFSMSGRIQGLTWPITGVYLAASNSPCRASLGKDARHYFPQLPQG